MGDKGIITHDALFTTTGSARITFTVGGGSLIGEIGAAPHPNFVSAAGDVLITFAGTTFVLPDAIIDTQNKAGSGDGTQITYRIRSRIWRWEEGGDTISGWYNRRKPNGEIVTESEKSPRQLAMLCLDVLNETGVDLSQLPDNSRPETIWDAARPFEALQEILRDGGCRHVYCQDDVVRVVRLGVGIQTLPSDDRIDPPDNGTDNVARPDSIVLVGGRTLWELTFKLEAVGLDTDDSIKLIDDLSYKPAGLAWEENDVQGGNWNLAVADEDNPTELEKEKIKRAQQTVYRWFRIKGLADGTLDVPGFPASDEDPGDPEVKVTVEDIEQFEFRNSLINTVTDFEGAEKAIPAYLEGVYCDDHIERTNPGTRFQGGFSIDGKERIVKISMIAYTEGGEFPDLTLPPARLFLRTSCWIRANTKWNPIRFSKEYDLGRNLGTGSLPVRHEEVVRTIIVPYDVDGSGTYTAGDAETNDATIDSQSDIFMQAHSADFDVVHSEESKYNGFKPILPSGTVRQVSYLLSDGEATTQVSLNNEHEAVIPTFEEIRRRQRAGDARVERQHIRTHNRPQVEEPQGLSLGDSLV